MPFEKELQYFAAHKDELLKHYRGQLVLIVEDQLIGAFTTESEAYEAGLRRFGNRPLFIRRVTADEEVVRVPALTLGVVDARPQ